MSILKKVSKARKNVSILLFGLLTSTGAAATAGVTNLGSLASQVGSQAGAAESGFVQAIGFVGLVIFAICGIKLFNGKENQQEKKGPLFMGLLCGVFCMGLYFWLAVISNTVDGKTQSADQLKTIIKGTNSQ